MATATASGANIGHITQVIGSTFDVEFDEDKLPAIYNAVKVQSEHKGVKLNLTGEVQQAVHVSFGTRQSRKGEISSWKAYAPAHAGKLAVEAVDRAMRGEGAPNPIYEGEDSVIAWMLAGRENRAHEYLVPLPEKDEPKRAILESDTRESLLERLHTVEHRLLPAAVREWLR